MRLSNQAALTCARLAAHLPRGYGRILPLLADRFQNLQLIEVDILACGHMTLDLRESVCIPLFVRGLYPHQMAEDDFVKTAVPKGACVFDIGANIGYYTRLLSRLVGEDGTVVAVEPMPRALRLLRRNAADLSNVSLMPVAIGESNDSYADLHEAGKLDVSSVAFGTTGSTPVVSIDSLAATVRPPAFVKVDVEGAELLALKGAYRVLSEIKPIVMFEYIQSTATCYGASRLQDLLDCFGAGYNFFRIGKPLRLLPVNSTETDNNNYAAIPNNVMGKFGHLTDRAVTTYGQARLSS